jgi:hypothetical protein
VWQKPSNLSSVDSFVGLLTPPRRRTWENAAGGVGPRRSARGGLSGQGQRGSGREPPKRLPVRQVLDPVRPGVSCFSQELVQASQTAGAYCLKYGSQPMVSNIVTNPNGTKTVTFQCGLR